MINRFEINFSLKTMTRRFLSSTWTKIDQGHDSNRKISDDDD